MSIRANIAHAYPWALLCAALCVVALPAVAPTAVVIVCAILAFASFIGLFLYLQGDFSKPPNTDELKD